MCPETGDLLMFLKIEMNFFITMSEQLREQQSFVFLLFEAKTEQIFKHVNPYFIWTLMYIYKKNYVLCMKCKKYICIFSPVKYSVLRKLQKIHSWQQLSDLFIQMKI